MVYLYYISCLRYTIFVGNPRCIHTHMPAHAHTQFLCTMFKFQYRKACYISVWLYGQYKTLFTNNDLCRKGGGGGRGRGSSYFFLACLKNIFKLTVYSHSEAVLESEYFLTWQCRSCAIPQNREEMRKRRESFNVNLKQMKALRDGWTKKKAVIAQAFGQRTWHLQ